MQILSFTSIFSATEWVINEDSEREHSLLLYLDTALVKIPAQFV